MKLKWGFSLGPLINVTFVLYKNVNHLTILFKFQSICLGIFFIFAKCIILEIRADLILVIQSCPALYNSMDCSPPGSSVHGISQARIQQWVVIPISSGSSWPRDWTQVSYIAGGFCTVWDTREVLDFSELGETWEDI